MKSLNINTFHLTAIVFNNTKGGKSLLLSVFGFCMCISLNHKPLFYSTGATLLNPANWSSLPMYALGMTLLLVLVGMFVTVVVR